MGAESDGAAEGAERGREWVVPRSGRAASGVASERRAESGERRAELNAELVDVLEAVFDPLFDAALRAELDAGAAAVVTAERGSEVRPPAVSLLAERFLAARIRRGAAGNPIFEHFALGRH